MCLIYSLISGNALILGLKPIQISLALVLKQMAVALGFPFLQLVRLCIDCDQQAGQPTDQEMPPLNPFSTCSSTPEPGVDLSNAQGPAGQGTWVC